MNEIEIKQKLLNLLIYVFFLWWCGGSDRVYTCRYSNINRLKR